MEVKNPVTLKDIIVRELECGGQKCVLGNALSVGAFLDMASNWSSGRVRSIYEMRVLLRRGPSSTSGSREEQTKKLTENFSKYLSGFHLYTIKIWAAKNKTAKINFHLIPTGEGRFALINRASKKGTQGLSANLMYDEMEKCVLDEMTDKMPQEISNGENIYAQVGVKNRMALSLYKSFMFIPGFRLSNIRFDRIPDLKKDIEGYLGGKVNTEIRNSSMAHSLAVKIQTKMNSKYPPQRYFYFCGKGAQSDSTEQDVQTLSQAESLAVYLMAGFKKQCINFESIIEYCDKPVTLITGREGDDHNAVRFLGNIMNIYEEAGK